VLEVLEDRTVPSTILWTNRGTATNDSDGFNGVFGANAEAARNVVARALLDWQLVIVSFNYSDPNQQDTYRMTVSMATRGTGLGAIATPTNQLGGKPTQGRMTISRGNDTTGDGVGDGAGWFLDPTPGDHSEFLGAINNAFYGLATPGGPAAGLADLYTAILHEAGHALGFTPAAAYRLRSGGRESDTGQRDTVDQTCTPAPGGGLNCPTTADYWRFDGPSIRHLMTAYDSGGAGGTPSDFGYGHHSAPAGATWTAPDGTIYSGANDLMNPILNVGERRLIPNTLALILQDAYGYQIELPQTFATFYAVLNRTTGQLRVRGVDGSNDVITVSRQGLGIRVSVDIGNDVPATGTLPGAGNLPAFATDFTGTVRSIVIESGSGDDTININTSARSLAIYAGDGDDTINIETLPLGMDRATLDGGSGRDKFYFTRTTGDLNNIQSPVTINGGALSDGDELWLNDANSPGNNRTYRVSATTLQTPGSLSTITYANVGRILVSGGAGSGTTANVIGTAAGTSTVIENADIANVGGPSPLPFVAGTFTEPVHGGLEIRNTTSTPTALTITDTGNGRPRTITLESRRVLGLTDQPIVFNNILYPATTLSSLTINAGSGGNTVVVGNTLSSARVGSITLNTGTGADTVRVERTETQVTLNGQDGADTVLMGLAGSVRGVNAPLTVTNGRSWSSLTLDDSADRDRRDVTLTRVGTYAQVSGLAPAVIRVRQQDLRAFTILGGSGNNVFTVRDTPLSTIVGGMTTTLLSGAGNDVVTVTGTTGPIVVDGQGSLNQFVIGGNPTGLNRINGAVTVRGAGGLNYLTVNDAPSTTTHTYVLDRNLVQRIDKAAISYQDLTSLSVIAGATYDTITVRDTTPGLNTDVQSGGGNDYFAVARTTGNLHLAAGGSSFIEVGNNVTSLDAIQGAISVDPVGGNTMSLLLNDSAATAPQTLNADANVFGQTYARSGAAAISVFFSPVTTFEYVSGSGGTVMHANSTAAGTVTQLVGHAGVLDIFTVGFGADTTKILGAVSVYGQAADNDFAYYYDYLNPNPQTYTVSTSLAGALLVQHPGVALVEYYDLAAVLFYMPVVGGNTAEVLSVPAPTGLGIVAAGGDVVTLGAPTGFGRTLVDIRGAVSVYGPSQSVVSLVVDDSGNTDTTPRSIEITTATGNYAPGTTLVGLTPPAIYWNLSTASSVAIRGGAGDKTFALTGNPSVAAVSIDGGGGINTLDYSNVQASGPGVYVNLQTGQATGLTGGVSRLQNVIGSAGDDILVGNGGNALFGGAGRDLLIAGASASQLFGGGDEDILIGGTLNDGSRANLDAIMAEWTRTGDGNDYASRVARLRASLLADGTITGNGGGNTLTGEGGLDLFFGSFVTDWQVNDGEWVFPL
jgi:hypothetical protein